MADTLSPNERRRLALDALTAERSVVRAYREPHRVRESTWLRIRDAAARLGLHVPPERSSGPALKDRENHAETAPGSTLFRPVRKVPLSGRRSAVPVDHQSTQSRSLSEQPSNSPPSGREVAANYARSRGAWREPATNWRRTRLELASNPPRTGAQAPPNARTPRRDLPRRRCPALPMHRDRWLLIP